MRWMGRVERWLRALPLVERQLERQYAKLTAELDADLHPYRTLAPAVSELPRCGRPHAEIMATMGALAEREERRTQDGFASGAVYHGDPAHVDFLNRVYALHAQANPLHADLWPSIVKYEAEIVAMTARMLGAGPSAAQVCGTVTSGGTESILLAVKSYRDRARAERGVRRPEMILPTTAHAAFAKAAHLFGVKPVYIPVGVDYRANVEAAAQAITRRTILIVGSAPAFPHGTIDPIAELSTLAAAHAIGFHTDACLGGFVLPWAERLGAAVPPFDFRLPGVTSISADTHKYGYAPKGTSVLLYRDPALRRYQYYTAADWPGGLYVSPTLAGSRPGALSAACWAAMLSMGEEGYLEATRRILAAGWLIRRWIEETPELEVLGDPLWVIAFRSPTLDIYRVLAQMSQRGWSLNGLHHPPAIHLAVTLRHTQPGVAQRFIDDLRSSLAHVKAHPAESGGMAPVYGMAASLPFRGVVDDLLRRYVDLLYRV